MKFSFNLKTAKIDYSSPQETLYRNCNTNCILSCVK